MSCVVRCQGESFPAYSTADQAANTRKTKSRRSSMLRGSPLSSVLRYAILGTGILAVVTCTSAQTIFRSSNGRFSAQVPSKWNIAEDQSSGQVKFSQGNVSASLGVERTDNGETPSAAEVLDGITQQLKDQCSSAKVVKHGAATLSEIKRGGLQPHHFTNHKHH